MKEFYKKYKHYYPKENYYRRSTQKKREDNKEQSSNLENDELNDINLDEILDEEENDLSNKKEYDYDQALSLNNKFKTENIKLEKNNKKDLFFSQKKISKVYLQFLLKIVLKL